jgi:hypothetical protein
LFGGWHGGAAQKHRITLVEMGNPHTTLFSHQAVLKVADGRNGCSYYAGGMANLKC